MTQPVRLSLLAAPDVAVQFPITVGGHWDLTLTWPNDASLDGCQLSVPAVAVPTGSAVERTNGVGFTFRR